MMGMEIEVLMVLLLMVDIIPLDLVVNVVVPMVPQVVVMVIFQTIHMELVRSVVLPAKDSE